MKYQETINNSIFSQLQRSAENAASRAPATTAQRSTQQQDDEEQQHRDFMVKLQDLSIGGRQHRKSGKSGWDSSSTIETLDEVLALLEAEDGEDEQNSDDQNS